MQTFYNIHGQPTCNAGKVIEDQWGVTTIDWATCPGLPMSNLNSKDDGVSAAMTSGGRSVVTVYRDDDKYYSSVAYAGFPTS